MEIGATGDAGKVEAFIPEHQVVSSPRYGRGHPSRSTLREQAASLEALCRGVALAVSPPDGALSVAMGVPIVLAAERSAGEGRPLKLMKFNFGRNYRRTGTHEVGEIPRNA
jgi:hypothetical protein